MQTTTNQVPFLKKTPAAFVAPPTGHLVLGAGLETDTIATQRLVILPCGWKSPASYFGRKPCLYSASLIYCKTTLIKYLVLNQLAVAASYTQKKKYTLKCAKAAELSSYH